MGTVEKLRRVLHCELSSRQREIIKWAADGKRNHEIEPLMSVSRSVIQAELTDAMDLTGTCSRTALVAFALRNGLIS